jgi:drug/metabolite transporter (DMT)-like permease
MNIRVENEPNREVSPRAGRLWIVAAALLWSSSGVFAKLAIFDDWPLESRGALLGFWRALFAGALLLPFVRRPRWTPRLVPMTISFAGMNATFLTAMTLTTAANAIWLQSTAPLWVFAIGLLWRTEPFDRRNVVPVVCAAAGVGMILYHEIAGEAQTGVICGLAAGMFYASVILSLRGLRHEDSAWLVAINHLVAAAALAPYMLWLGILPSGQQLLVLAAFGMLQMALPYLCFARGLRGISGQEASGIGLIEPVIMPLWVFLASSEVPAWWTLAGGGLIFAGLAWRYLRSDTSDAAGQVPGN